MSLADENPIPRYALGQYVETLATIQSSFGGSIESGTRGVIREIDVTKPDDVYLVAFLANGRLTGEAAWMRKIDLLPA